MKKIKKCPQCKFEMKPWIFNVGYGAEIESMHCTNCKFNITEKNKLEKGIETLKENMKKEVKIIKVGTGLGLRFPNEIVKNYKLKKGVEITIQPDIKGLKLLI